MRTRTKLYVLAAVATVLLIVVTYAGRQDIEEVAKFYYERSTFVTGSNTSFLGEAGYQPENVAPKGALRPAEPVEVDASEVVKKAGVAGSALGTYRYNMTHLVTLVLPQGASFPALYAVVWNNETAVGFDVKFTKYREVEVSRTFLRDGNYTYVVGQRSVGYVAENLPFTVASFYDENWGQWNTPTGYFKVATAGYFTVIYGVAVYVYNASYYELRDPSLMLCKFNSYVSGSGMPSASVRAYGRADLLTCRAGFGTAFDITATIGYDAWLNRFAPPATGNKWFTFGCCR